MQTYINFNLKLIKIVIPTFFSFTTCPVHHFIYQNIFIHLPKTTFSVITVSFQRNLAKIVFISVVLSCKGLFQSQRKENIKI